MCWQDVSDLWIHLHHISQSVDCDPQIVNTTCQWKGHSGESDFGCIYVYGRTMRCWTNKFGTV